MKGAILVQFCSNNCMKIKKSHNFSEYNLNDLEMTLKVIGKMSNRGQKQKGVYHIQIWIGDGAIRDCTGN